MRSADPILLGLGLVVFYMTFPLRALRWRMLLAQRWGANPSGPAQLGFVAGAD